MPNTKSAKKALRQSIKRHQRNLVKKTKFRMLRKEFRKAIEEKNEKKARETLNLLYKALDKMAKTNIFHKNKSGRLKAYFASKLNKEFSTSSK